MVIRVGLRPVVAVVFIAVVVQVRPRTVVVVQVVGLYHILYQNPMMVVIISIPSDRNKGVFVFVIFF